MADRTLVTDTITFASLGLAEPLMRAVADVGFVVPTPIQAQAIPAALAGRDVLGIAQTGTGKTAAFGLPLLHRLLNQGGRPPRGGCRALILSPTRELASQIAAELKSYARHTGLTHAVVFGGVPEGPQKRAIMAGVDILVATPGRLMDHMSQGTLRLDHVTTLVLDEADQMLDRGFLPAARKIVARVPAARQTLFFSATMPTEIDRLAAEMLREPVRVSVAPVATTAERVDQRVIHVGRDGKRAALSALLAAEGVGRVLVFSRTKHGADRIVKQLEQDGVQANAIHGNRSQSQREKALAAFKAGTAPVLVATDIAARGIDVPGVTHVIQYDLPEVPETYVHRIGRTARAGASGEAVALVSPDDISLLRAIEKLTRQQVPASGDVPLPGAPIPKPAPRGQGRQQQNRGGEHRGGGGGRDPRRAAAPAGHAPARRPDAPRPAAPRGAPGGAGRHASPSAPREAAEGRKDRGWRDQDFRDGGASDGGNSELPAFLRRGR
ncbi:DEAD/DEAH box helicase [Humitalea sp. 24SJ18S-53]|uniref:DEAD/DEAH box helicase n=1 Tax=Humitalea sp. 24SJ18S-53 TaxID=3422307 RepID=UPI003D67458A